MTILLIIWVCGSMALCLAFLGAAARRVPRLDEQMAAGAEAALGQQTAVELGKAKMPHCDYYPGMSARGRQGTAALGPVPRRDCWVPRPDRELVESASL